MTCSARKDTPGDAHRAHQPRPALGLPHELKEIGAYDDEATGLRGVRRLALTDADAVARRRCVNWMIEAGLAVRVDRIGNVYATRPGRDRSLPCVLMGSHIDTVATGGAFDGTLGVLGGIEVMRTLNDASIETLRDIEVAFFTEEEGVRFGTDMLGSAVTAGRIPLDHARKLADQDGKTVQDELIRIGFDGDACEQRPIPHAYIECHIEQGPILADAGVDIGIVEGVQSISWQRLTIRGEAAHAGTTPIAARHDAGLAAASVVVEARRMCDSGDFGQLRATVGNFDIGGGQTNVIPHMATLTIDLRNPADDLMTATEQHLASYACEFDHLNLQLRSRPHPFLGPGNLHASLISGGTGESTIPDRCVFTVERRTLPGETLEHVEADIANLIERCRPADPRLVVSARTILHRPPMETPAAAPIVQAVVAAAGPGTTLVPMSYWADSAFLAAAGIPTVLYGPEGDGAHADTEWASRSGTSTASTVLTQLAKDYCS